ncbi:hypothetical protein AX17_007291 [Amanita inopinata Kibby_2008]|nr:hypothetical protein AX17_007291 [Amanita inopinata Kibby_2008]
MPFFEGAKDFDISKSTFKDINGDYVKYNGGRPPREIGRTKRNRDTGTDGNEGLPGRRSKRTSHRSDSDRPTFQGANRPKSSGYSNLFAPNRTGPSSTTGADTTLAGPQQTDSVIYTNDRFSNVNGNTTGKATSFQPKPSRDMNPDFKAGAEMRAPRDLPMKGAHMGRTVSSASSDSGRSVYYTPSGGHGQNKGAQTGREHRNERTATNMLPANDPIKAVKLRPADKTEGFLGF